jgi:4-hydroxymandelate oxidase
MTKPPLNAIPRDVVAVRDYEPYARDRLDDNAWVYLTAGAGDEITLKDNIDAFARLKLKGRVLADVRGGHTWLELFGETYQHPIFLAPVATQKLFHADGELATAMGAGAMDANMVLSTLSSTRLEDVAANASGPLWFQLYMQPEIAASMSLVRRAEAAGYKAIVITVDAPLSGVRNAEQRVGFALPAGVSAVNLEGLTPPALMAGASVVFDTLMGRAPLWTDIERIIASTGLPVLIKGIVAPEDAAKAFDIGAAGIVVSNHGGRVLDTLPATIDALPAIIAAAAGRGPVLLDGGIRRGTDVFKALALGASAVMIGRPYIHALAAAGALGVAHAVRTLREELEVCMALCGTPTLAAIGPDAVMSKPNGSAS